MDRPCRSEAHAQGPQPRRARPGAAATSRGRARVRPTAGCARRPWTVALGSGECPSHGEAGDTEKKTKVLFGLFFGGVIWVASHVSLSLCLCVYHFLKLPSLQKKSARFAKVPKNRTWIPL